MWCFFQGHAFLHIIARTGISGGRLTVCWVQDSCWKLSAEVWGTWKTILLCLRTTLGNRERCKEQPSKSQEPLWSGISIQYHSNSRNRTPLCASRHRAQQLVLNGSNTYRANSSVRYRHPNTSVPVLAACGPRRARRLSPTGRGGLGLSSPLCQQLALGKSLHRPDVPFAASVCFGCRLSLPV